MWWSEVLEGFHISTCLTQSDLNLFLDNRTWVEMGHVCRSCLLSSLAISSNTSYALEGRPWRRNFHFTIIFHVNRQWGLEHKISAKWTGWIHILFKVICNFPFYGQQNLPKAKDLSILHIPNPSGECVHMAISKVTFDSCFKRRLCKPLIYPFTASKLGNPSNHGCLQRWYCPTPFVYTSFPPYLHDLLFLVSNDPFWEFIILQFGQFWSEWSWNYFWGACFLFCR